MSAERPEETEAERADRNFAELLQELRVTQTGIQILFAFLLTMPLQNRFTTLDRTERGLFVAALLLAACATVALIAPVAYHRALFGMRLKHQVVLVASRFAVAGLALLGLAIVTSVSLVLDLVLGPGAASGLGIGLALVLALTWLVLPLTRRAKHVPLPPTVEQAPDGGPGADH